MGASDQFGFIGILGSCLDYELLPTDESSNTSIDELGVSSLQLCPLGWRFLLQLQGETSLCRSG